jgi:hypothetical protein
MEENRKESEKSNKEDVNSVYNDEIGRVTPQVDDTETLIKKNRLTLHF